MPWDHITAQPLAKTVLLSYDRKDSSMFSGTVPMCDEEGESIKHSPQHYEGNDDNQIAESICDDLQFGSLVRRGYGTDDARRASAIVQEQPPERLWFVAQRMLFDADARHRLSGGKSYSDSIHNVQYHMYCHY
jgi:hypothetical protein